MTKILDVIQPVLKKLLGPIQDLTESVEVEQQSVERLNAASEDLARVLRRKSKGQLTNGHV